MASAQIRLARRRGDLRSEEQLREHYLIERELADRLRGSTKDERRVLYRAVYDELLRRVPHHPRQAEKRDDAWYRRRRRDVEREVRFLARFLSLRTVFLEVGEDNNALALRVCDFAERVYAVDVSCQSAIGAPRPANFSFLFTEGCNMPVPERSVNVAFSNQLMEHLHPDDALEQLRNIFAALAPGGVYICLTPNRLNGPHDISRHFQEEADCFHLKEYTVTELDELFRTIGFRRVDAYARVKQLWSKVPLEVIRSLERWLQDLPPAQRRGYADHWPLRPLLNGALVAYR